MKKKTVVKIAIGVVVIAAAAAAGTYFFKAYQKSKTASQEITPESLIETVSRNDLRESITASGTVYLADEYEIYAEGETNKIKSFAVEEGDSVTEGQLLVEYDVDDTKEDLEKSIKQAKINLENEELSVQSYLIPKTDAEMQQLQNAITQAEKSVYDAESTLNSYSTKIAQQNTTIETAKKDLDKNTKTVEEDKQLLELGGITREDYDTAVDTMEKSQITYDDAVTALNDLLEEQNAAELSLNIAKNSLAEAQSDYELAQDIFSDEKTKLEYEQKLNSIELEKISLADYEKQLADLVYDTKSTVNGIVTEVCVDEGTYTEENTVLLKIANYDDLIVKASISEYDAPLLELGQSVEMTSDGIEDTVYTGKIIKIGLSAESAETTMGSETVVPIEISVENPDGILKPSYTLDLEIINVNREQALTVSGTSIGTNEMTGESYVYKIDEDNAVYKTVVETGVEGEIYTEILSGLTDGDRVLNTVEMPIKDGTKLDELLSGNSETGQFRAGQQRNAESGSEEKSGGKSDMGGGMGGMSGGMGGGMSGGGGGMPGGGGMGGGPR